MFLTAKILIIGIILLIVVIEIYDRLKFRRMLKEANAGLDKVKRERSK